MSPILGTSQFHANPGGWRPDQSRNPGHLSFPWTQTWKACTPHFSWSMEARRSPNSQRQAIDWSSLFSVQRDVTSPWRARKRHQGIWSHRGHSPQISSARSHPPRGCKNLDPGRWRCLAAAVIAGRGQIVPAFPSLHEMALFPLPSWPMWPRTRATRHWTKHSSLW